MHNLIYLTRLLGLCYFNISGPGVATDPYPTEISHGGKYLSARRIDMDRGMSMCQSR